MKGGLISVQEIEKTVQEHEKRLERGDEKFKKLDEQLHKLHQEMNDGLQRVDQSNQYLREQNNHILDAVISGNVQTERDKHEIQMLNKANMWKLILGVSSAAGLLTVIIDKLFDLLR